MASIPEMDRAGEQAREQLRKLLDGLPSEQREGAKKIALWWQENYMQAGHKRLGRALLAEGSKS